MNNKCTKRNCPIQFNKISDDCDVKKCAFRTEEQSFENYKLTNEEAVEQIKIIKNFTHFDEENQMVIRLHKALDMAIKLLESQPCEDCISRQMAIDAIKKISPVDTEYDCTLYDKLDVMYVLKDLPAVTPIKENDLDEKMKEYKLGFQDGYVAGNKQSCEEREKGECPYYAG